jgi:hypothetical protein
LSAITASRTTPTTAAPAISRIRVPASRPTSRTPSPRRNPPFAVFSTALLKRSQMASARIGPARRRMKTAMKMRPTMASRPENQCAACRDVESGI